MKKTLSLNKKVLYYLLKIFATAIPKKLIAYNFYNIWPRISLYRFSSIILEGIKIISTTAWFY